MPLSALALRLSRLAFLACLVAVMVLSLLPSSPEMPTTGWDKTNHLLGFAVLALLGCWSYPGHIRVILPALLGYGGLIEVLQSLTPDRFAEWGDLLADGMGIVIGWLLAWVLAARVRRRAAGAPAQQLPGE
jgi:VanZ family protein